MGRIKKRGLIAQTFIMIIAAAIVIGIFTYVTQFQIAKGTVRSQNTAKAAEAIGEVILSVKEYPAYSWLLSYWAEHAKELEIEYDADYADNTVTKGKCELLAVRHPELQLRYCTPEEVEALEEEDQKLYAEIVYSWLITRIDAIKHNFGCSYLFCVMTDTDEGEDPYGMQLFLMSGADPDSVRGTEYEQVYTLGVTVPTDHKGTQEAMRAAVESASASGNSGAVQVVGEKMKDAGKYLDFYSVLELMDGKAVLVGVTYYQGEMINEIRWSTLRHSMIAMFYQILLIGLVIRRVFLYMLRPLQKVLLAIRSYTASKDSRAIEADMEELLSGKDALVIRQNEIGQLTEDIVELAKEIDDYTEQIERETAVRERIGYELETAARIQAHMLPEAHPEFPDHPEFSLSASMTPARDVGGDFYDYFLIDDHHLVLVMADVSDKGIPAALFMAQAKALIKSRAVTGEEPAQIFSHVNDQLCKDNDDGFFVTVWMAVIDLRTGEGIAANAGHEHPALCRRGEEFELVVYKHDLVIGMMENITFRQHTFTLYPGDRLFVYTDGVPEASNASEEQFGTARMLKALNSRPGALPQELLEDVSTAVDTFMGDVHRFDDTTMMCLYYAGTGESSGSETEEC